MTELRVNVVDLGRQWFTRHEDRAASTLYRATRGVCGRSKRRSSGEFVQARRVDSRSRCGAGRTSPCAKSRGLENGRPRLRRRCCKAAVDAFPACRSSSCRTRCADVWAPRFDAAVFQLKWPRITSIQSRNASGPRRVLRWLSLGGTVFIFRATI